MYLHLKKYYKHKASIEEGSRLCRGEMDEATLRILASSQKVVATTGGVQHAAADIKKDTEEKKSSRPINVDGEVDKLIRSPCDMKLTEDQVSLMLTHAGTARLLQRRSNYAYFIAQAYCQCSRQDDRTLGQEHAHCPC